MERSQAEPIMASEEWNNRIIVLNAHYARQYKENPATMKSVLIDTQVIRWFVVEAYNIMTLLPEDHELHTLPMERQDRATMKQWWEDIKTWKPGVSQDRAEFCLRALIVFKRIEETLL